METIFKMKKYFSVLVLLLFGQISFAQNKPIEKVTAAIEQLRIAMINADSKMLYKLTNENLSYGHSSGAVDDKKIFIEKLVSGTSDFVTINLTEQTITVSKQTAIVRHILNATTNDNGKAGEVHLKVMQVWQKEKASWKLLARQAIKI
jgi:ketosteroid isomerase-like protein